MTTIKNYLTTIKNYFLQIFTMTMTTIKNYFLQNKDKTFYVLIFPIAMIFYYSLFLWVLKFSKWINKNLSPLWSMINSVFLSSPSSIFICFVFPMIFGLVICNIMDPAVVISGLVTFAIGTIAVVAMPIIFVDFKRSSLLKRVFISRIKPSIVIFAFISYFFIVSLISIIFNTTILYFLFEGNNIDHKDEDLLLSDIVKDINFGSVFVGIFLSFLVYCFVGILISSIAKTSMIALAIGLTFVLPGAFLSGQFLNPVLIEENEILRYASFAFPQKYSTNMVIGGFHGYDIFSFNDFFLYDNYDNIITYPLLKITGLPDDLEAGDFPVFLASKKTILNKNIMIAGFVISTIIPIFGIPFGIKKFKWTAR